MDWFSWVILGVIQGLTEFLPVSSSGHLVLAQNLLGLDSPGILLEVIVHVATAAAVVALFAGELWRMLLVVLRWPFGRGAARPDDTRWRGLVINLLLATATTTVIGFGFEPLFRDAFERPVVAAAMLLVTGAVLFLSARLARGRRGLDDLRDRKSVV